ncbi:hypothetical protein [Salipiger thiooxidans]|jgi:hypothetical protein|uniref:hypothetical protein n=1 Tax=Salipiger thiooxidans TaxID=282683 RepID=UPI001CD7ADF2|nr:hypothetical protein [Salipiger thiooxidans]MCA0851219.1 hypothetical protein [Salipiger thiooxidans]
MSNPADLLAAFPPRDRRDLQTICEVHGLSPEALVVEMTSAYLRLVREVPDALPRNPMSPVYAGARRRGSR